MSLCVEDPSVSNSSLDFSPELQTHIIKFPIKNLYLVA